MLMSRLVGYLWPRVGRSLPIGPSHYADRAGTRMTSRVLNCLTEILPCKYLNAGIEAQSIRLIFGSRP